MSEAMGVDVRRLFTLVFGIGAALCAVAGALLGPLLAVQVGMGENILILAFVVIVIGGIGSIRGALIGALLVGCVDTLGRTLLQQLFREFLPPQWASAAGPALRVDRGVRVHGRGARGQAAGPVPGARVMAHAPEAIQRLRGSAGRNHAGRVGAAVDSAGARRVYYLSMAQPHRGLRDRRHQPEPRARLRRHGVVRPRRVRRPGRLRHRRPDQRGHAQRPARTCWPRCWSPALAAPRSARSRCARAACTSS